MLSADAVGAGAVESAFSPGAKTLRISSGIITDISAAMIMDINSFFIEFSFRTKVSTCINKRAAV